MSSFLFPYQEDRARDGTSVYRPSVTISVKGIDGRWWQFRLYADAGADITLLRLLTLNCLAISWNLGNQGTWAEYVVDSLEPFCTNPKLDLEQRSFPARLLLLNGKKYLVFWVEEMFLADSESAMMTFSE